MARNRPDRRTVLKTIGALAAGGVATAASGTAAATGGERARGETTGETAARLTGPVEDSPSGLYRGTVDRIVDGDHVVILLEDDGEVVGQVVEPRERHPDLAESEEILVWMYDGDPVAVW